MVSSTDDAHMLCSNEVIKKKYIRVRVSLDEAEVGFEGVSGSRLVDTRKHHHVELLPSTAPQTPC